MAVPKKRTSISKKNIRKSLWKRKGYAAAKKAFSLGESISTSKSKSFCVDCAEKTGKGFPSRKETRIKSRKEIRIEKRIKRREYKRYLKIILQTRKNMQVSLNTKLAIMIKTGNFSEEQFNTERKSERKSESTWVSRRERRLQKRIEKRIEKRIAKRQRELIQEILSDPNMQLLANAIFAIMIKTGHFSVEQFNTERKSESTSVSRERDLTQEIFSTMNLRQISNVILEIMIKTGNFSEEPFCRERKSERTWVSRKETRIKSRKEIRIEKRIKRREAKRYLTKIILTRKNMQVSLNTKLAIMIKTGNFSAEQFNTERKSESTWVS